MKALSEIIVKSENETKNIGGLISRLLKKIQTRSKERFWG
jgi:hypothetical protein